MESSESTAGDDWIDSAAAFEDHLMVVESNVGPKKGDVPCRSGLRPRDAHGLANKRAGDAFTSYSADGIDVGSPVGSPVGALEGSDVGIVGSEVGSPVGRMSGQSPLLPTPSTTI